MMSFISVEWKSIYFLSVRILLPILYFEKVFFNLYRISPILQWKLQPQSEAQLVLSK